MFMVVFFCRNSFANAICVLEKDINILPFFSASCLLRSRNGNVFFVKVSINITTKFFLSLLHKMMKFYMAISNTLKNDAFPSKSRFGFTKVALLYIKALLKSLANISLNLTFLHSAL